MPILKEAIVMLPDDVDVCQYPIECPHCGTWYFLDVSFIEGSNYEELVCMKCGQKFILPGHLM